jgi:regulator of sirC expression with transglutaminase-like and TPR domain
MKWFHRVRDQEQPIPEDTDAAIRLYRRHAAQAISEERWQVAEVFLNRIIEVAPDHTEAWLMKGWLRHHCRHDEATALECYQRVLSLCAHDADHPHVQRAKRSLGRIMAAAV